MEVEVKAKPGDQHGKTIQVSIYTTSGAFPRKGSHAAPVNQIVDRILNEAQNALKLTDVSGWEATVDGKVVDSHKSYRDNHLTGTIVIHWGPREGGGGC